ncbi:MAG: hypothetical protein ABJM36_14645 [Algibacter sp.]|uniref:hypothetical protein n=1 Tax=Algibacter sp. TaxID=1872428 RepID=UPI003296A781
MSKKTIIKGIKTENENFEEVIEVSYTSTNKIYITLGNKKILLALSSASELAHQIKSDIEFLNKQ